MTALSIGICQNGPKLSFDRSSDAAAQKLKAVVQSGMPHFSASMAAVRTKLTWKPEV